MTTKRPSGAHASMSGSESSSPPHLKSVDARGSARAAVTTEATAPRRNVLIKEVMPDKSSRAAGQVFGPDRPHKSLHVMGRRLRTNVLVTGLEVTRRPDMPSKSVCGRKLAGGFDSRPPPLESDL
jgi:hypothetical protein